MLHTETTGTGPRVVLVHGFAQNTNCWGPLVDRLASNHEVVLVDAPGHGQSGHDEAGLVEAAELIVEAGGPATYVGYSMGARMVLHAAVNHADRVSAAVLISATPGLVDGREERQAADSKLAERIKTDGVEDFVDYWLALPIFADLAQPFRAERLANRPEGLAASLRHCGTGAQEPLWSRLDELAMPVNLIVGGNDAKFLAINEAMPFPLQIVAGAGHAPHLAHPDQVAEIVARSIV